MGFPHSEFTRNLGWHNPDVLFWTGDQVYEPVGGFGVMETREPELLIPSMHDYLRKWYIFGWATRDLTRNIPSVCMPDDHDMYHGNIWGCGGKPTDPNAAPGDATQDSGGYKMPPRWVNMAQRTQTSHLPDPFDATPVEQGISVYYTHLLWGGISFAVLEDRSMAFPRTRVGTRERMTLPQQNCWGSDSSISSSTGRLTGVAAPG